MRERKRGGERSPWIFGTQSEKQREEEEERLQKQIFNRKSGFVFYFILHKGMT